MTAAAIEAKRKGLILRILPHGTVIVWDTECNRSYPYYKAGPQEFVLMEDVLFSTDELDTIVVELIRGGPPRKRASQRAKTVSDSRPSRDARLA